MSTRPSEGATWFSGELLGEVRDLLAASGQRLLRQHDEWVDGTYYLDVHAPGVAGAVRHGDLVRAGFHLMHDPHGQTSAGTRVYRVLCRNGQLALRGTAIQLVFDSEDAPYDWRGQLAFAVERSLSRSTIEAHTVQLQRASRRVEPRTELRLRTWLRAGQITLQEAETIRAAYLGEADTSLYGLINAVTASAHALRRAGRWDRAHAMERLGGEIGSGTETPLPVAAAPVG